VETDLIQDAALNHGVEFFRNMLQARVEDEGELADAVTRVAQAALHVSDIRFTFRTRALQPVTDEVAEVLQESRIPFERSPRLHGALWASFDAGLPHRDPHQGCPVCVLSTDSRSAARTITNSAPAACGEDLQRGAGGLSLGPGICRRGATCSQTASVCSFTTETTSAGICLFSKFRWRAYAILSKGLPWYPN
jgi:hypothetical protein